MKSLSFNRTIEMPGLLKVKVINELLPVRLIPSDDESVKVQLQLSFYEGQDEEPALDDYLDISPDEKNNTLTISLEDGGDASIDFHRSEATIYIPACVPVRAESDNFSLQAIDLQNDLDLENENGSIKAESCTGNLIISSMNGSVKVLGITGDISLEQENGSISGEGLCGDSLKITTENGSVKLRDGQYEDVVIRSENGGVYYESKPLEGGLIDIQSENGLIHLVLAANQGFILEAESEMGLVKNNFMGMNERTHGNYTTSYGDEKLIVKLATENGAIKLSSGDSPNSDYIGSKFEQIKDKLKDTSEGSVEELTNLINQLIAYLTKTMETISEDIAKEKLMAARDKLQAWKEQVDDPEFRAKAKETVEGIAKDITSSLQQAWKTAKAKIEKEFKQRFVFKFDSEHGHPVPPHPPHAPRPPHHFFDKEEFLKHIEPLKHLGRLGNLTDYERSAVADKSRMKILEMLESGKITAEEAEKLLKAIGKD